MTKRLYHDDSYADTFDAKTVDKLQVDGKPAIVLDQTLFYPTSGGQLHDTGYVNGIPVIDVFERDGVILHILKKDTDTEKIQGIIDRKRRFDHMQQHTGQHVLSASIMKTIGSETISVALGTDKSTIDIDRNSLNIEEANRAEHETMDWIARNVSVLILYPTSKELANMNLRKRPENLEGKKLRIIHIDGLDYSACGGTHTSRTGEVGIIKIIRWERMKNTIRIEFKCGYRALKDYQSKNRIINSVKDRLSTGETKIEESIQNLMTANKSLHKELTTVKQKLYELKSKEIFESGEKIRHFKIVAYNDPEGNINELKLLAKYIHKHGESVFFATDSDDKPSYYVSCSDSVNVDLMEILNSLRDRYEILGGGNQNAVQGKIVKNTEKSEFINSLKKSVIESLKSNLK